MEHSGGYVVLAWIPKGQCYNIHCVETRGFVSLFPISYCSPLSPTAKNVNLVSHSCLTKMKWLGLSLFSLSVSRTPSFKCWPNVELVMCLQWAKCWPTVSLMLVCCWPTDAQYLLTAVYKFIDNLALDYLCSIFTRQ